MIDSADNKDEMITQLSAEIEALKEQNKKLAEKITWFEEQIKISRHRKFGKQSEQTQCILLINHSPVQFFFINLNFLLHIFSKQQWIRNKRKAIVGAACSNNINGAIIKNSPRDRLINQHTFDFIQQ